VLGWLGGSKVDHPLADPKESKRMIADIPTADPLKAMGEVVFWLDSVNRTEAFRLDRRYDLLDQLDQAGKNHLRKLSQDYLQIRQQKYQEHRVWTAMFDFWRHVGGGYVQCIEGFQAGAAGAGSIKANVPAIVGRALRAVGQQLKWLLLRYGPLDDRLWSDLGRIYAFAEVKGFAERSVAIYPGAHGESSARKEFLKAAMLAASSTDSLLPNQVDLVERTVAFFSRLYVLDVQPSEVCTHSFDLAMRKPPARVQAKARPEPSVRYFGAGPGADELNRLLGVLLKEGVLPGDVFLGGDYEPQLVIDVWRHLANYWGPKPPARNSERASTNARLTVVRGFNELLQSLEPNHEESLDFSGGTPEDESESWVAENVSDGGYGAVVPAVKGDWLKVGALLGVQGESNGHWGVGVIRRISRDGEQNRHVGIQLLARAGIPVKLSPAGTMSSFNATREGDTAVLLSTQPDGNQQVKLLLRVGSFTPHQGLEMRVRGKAYLLMPVRLAEGGEEFDVGRFKVLQRVS